MSSRTQDRATVVVGQRALVDAAPDHHLADTLLAIVVTGNHYRADAAVAGALVVAAMVWWPGDSWVAVNSVGLRERANSTMR